MAAGRAAPASHIPDPLWVPSRCISGSISAPLVTRRGSPLGHRVVSRRRQLYREVAMRCRKNVRKLIQEYNAAAVADRPNTALMQVPQRGCGAEGGAEPAGAATHPGRIGTTTTSTSTSSRWPGTRRVIPDRTPVTAGRRSSRGTGSSYGTSRATCGPYPATRRSACPTGTGATIRARPTPATRSFPSSSAATATGPIVGADRRIRSGQGLGRGPSTTTEATVAATRSRRLAAALPPPGDVTDALAVSKYDSRPGTGTPPGRVASATRWRVGQPALARPPGRSCTTAYTSGSAGRCCPERHRTTPCSSSTTPRRTSCGRSGRRSTRGSRITFLSTASRCPPATPTSTAQ